MKRRKTSPTATSKTTTATTTTERQRKVTRAKALVTATPGGVGGTSEKVKMATKNCPQCNKQVPVACKKCGCGHVFFATRKSATSITRENSEDVEEMPMSPTDSEANKPTRRSGRVTRERPNFYDALQYENQTRRQKQLLRQSKRGKSEDQEEGSEDGDLKHQATRTQLSHDKSGKEVKTAAGEPKSKKRRGRPPGITGRKPNQGYKITTPTPSGKSRKTSGGGNEIKNPNSPNSDAAREAADKALMSSISPEKALQYYIVLQDINSKIHRVSWRAQE